MNQRPQVGEYAEYYQKYIDKVPQGNSIDLLKSSGKETLLLLGYLTDEQGNFRYADGKWSVKEVLMHIIDTERVMAYRALSFSRKEKQALPGFNENDFIANIDISGRTVASLLKEFSVVRRATITLFENFDQEMLAQIGTASGNQMSVRGLLYVILGHENHHRSVLKERYLPLF